MVILGATVFGMAVLGATGEARAQARLCGPYCQICVDMLRIPRGPSGEPLFRQSPVSKATFRECIVRSQPNGGVARTGNGKRTVAPP
ncbi:hypothetical protein VP06_21835 [Methylobacterium aquaticum]|uniref:Uncharacterized protein n=1 Tax=Methylobacterium aquaticum TaxID=270351 RepID=A0A0J6S9L1_9HYPH|nr:hypothetical protein VP06_21835 [Methylobacterium aquaticum]